MSSANCKIPMDNQVNDLDSKKLSTLPRTTLNYSQPFYEFQLI